MIIRPAAQTDVAAMSTIIGHHASRGVMLPRSKAHLSAFLTHYVVADLEGAVVGCGGLQPYSATSGEIYGLATIPVEAPRGTGRAIVESLIENARRMNLTSLFALTLVPGFFDKMGFQAVPHRELPLKVWKDCVACPKFGNCDEIAMVLNLDARDMEEMPLVWPAVQFNRVPASSSSRLVAGSTNERFAGNDVSRHEIVGWQVRK
jgi:amino-acid N-acetyltransferase